MSLVSEDFKIIISENSTILFFLQFYKPLSSLNCISVLKIARVRRTVFAGIKQCLLCTHQEMVEAAGEGEQELAAEMAAAFLSETLPEAVFGAPKAGSGMWASVIRVLNPSDGQSLCKVSSLPYSVGLTKPEVLKHGHRSFLIEGGSFTSSIGNMHALH